MGAGLAQCRLLRQSEESERILPDDDDLSGSKKQHLVYIDREFNRRISKEGMSTTSTRDPSDSSTKTSAKGMFVTQTCTSFSVPPSKLDTEKVERFQDFLESQDLNVSTWGGHGSKAMDQLYWEAIEQRRCHFIRCPATGNIERVVHLVKIKLVAEIFGVDHTLYSRMQFMHDGQQIERKQVPLRKLRWNILHDDNQHSAEELKAESCQHTEDWRAAARKALEERLGLGEKWQEKFLVEDVHAHTFHVEENVKSAGYPGLETSYCIHWITLRVSDPLLQGAACLGLPHGQEFATREGDFNFSAHDELGLPIGSQLNIWTWEREKRDSATDQAAARPSPVRSEPKGNTNGMADARAIKRVPLLAVSAHALADLQRRLRADVVELREPSGPLWAAMDGRQTDWAKARRIAQSLLDKKYTLAKFNEDLAAFPELHLYLLDHTKELGKRCSPSVSSVDTTREAQSMDMMSSGRTIGDEFQRTVGAFYAIFWLLRLHIDGKEGFCFGVDENWVPYNTANVNDERLYPADKRLLFHREGNWDYFKRLMQDAKLMHEDRRGRVRLNEKRVVSLLALTAVHDIMKMDMILPRVQDEHAPYHGYAAGDTVGDHDHALSYIMDYYPQLLPSFKGLDEDERRAVEFTQCRLQFNHGWFVQAEAPPGAIFTSFKEVLEAESAHGRVRKEDLALYFVHWLTDLAGAEPTPLGGCEKFVVKFPMMVLNSFLRSFEFVERIVDETETQVVEEYLKMRWRENTPPPGPLPTGDAAIAKMRLLCMAQMNAGLVLRAFDDVSLDDREVLCYEMALAGCAGQSYSASLCPKEVREKPCGPAFLIYYGPAFLQNMGNDRPVVKVSMLAEIYRSARVLWPAQAEHVAQNVTVRIDCIKGISIAEMRRATLGGDVWLMVKHNDSEAFIERSSQRKLNKFISSRQQVQILDINRAIDQGDAT